MKTLIVFRHGKSSWDNDRLSDYDRPLNDRGIEQVPMMAEVLLTYHIVPELIKVSTAKRTRQTTEGIMKTTNWNPEIVEFSQDLYHASSDELTNVIQNSDNKINTLMFVGHNPGLTQLINLYSNTRLDNLPTSGFCIIEFAGINQWKDVKYGLTGTLTCFEYPKKY
jgi:phosphohistidine phosphatase